MSCECKFEEVIPRIERTLDKIDKRTLKLLSIKHMFVGGFIVVTFLWSAALAILKYTQ